MNYKAEISKYSLFLFLYRLTPSRPPDKSTDCHASFIEEDFRKVPERMLPYLWELYADKRAAPVVRRPVALTPQTQQVGTSRCGVDAVSKLSVRYLSVFKM